MARAAVSPVRPGAVHDVLPRPVALRCWRQCSPRRSLAPVPGRTPSYPGRYHRPGSLNVCYLSDRETAAWAEYFRHTAGLGVAAAEVRRRVGRLRVELDAVLDLTDPDVRRSVGVSSGQLVGEDHAGCQDLALSAAAAGFHGILAPSAALPGRRMLVVLESGFGGVEIEIERIARPPRRVRDILHRVPVAGLDRSASARLVEQWLDDLAR